MNATTYQDTVTAVLRERYGGMRYAARKIADLVGVSQRTAESWLHGQSAPRGPELIRLMAHCEELADQITKMVAEQKCRNP